jgi:hypothetical protein
MVNIELLDLKERLSVRTYFLDAYYRLVEKCEGVDYQIIIDDGIKTYVRVMSADPVKKVAYITNYLEDYREFLSQAGITRLVDKLSSRYRYVQKELLKKYKISDYTLVYDVWELGEEKNKRIFQSALEEIDKKYPEQKFRLHSRKTLGDAVTKMLPHVPVYDGTYEYNKYIIALSIFKISEEK